MGEHCGTSNSNQSIQCECIVELLTVIHPENVSTLCTLQEHQKFQTKEEIFLLSM